MIDTVAKRTGMKARHLGIIVIKQGQDDDGDVKLCDECQRIFVNDASLQKHLRECPSKKKKDSAKEASKSKSSSPGSPPKYKPGPKSRKKALNPWLDIDRQSPDSSSLDTKRKSMVDLTDSEDEDHVTTTSSKPW